MKRHIIIAAALLLPSGMLASESTAIERTMVDELLVLMEVESGLSKYREQVIKMVEAQTKAQSEDMNLSEEEQERLTEQRKKVYDLLFEEMSWKNVKEECIDAYTAVYTQEELSGLLTFFRSPIGQAFTKKTPELTARMLEIAQRRVQKLTPQLQQMVDE